MPSSNDKLSAIRHSFSHVMAEAVLQLFPDAKVAIGPAIEDGFYYDFDLPRSLATEDLAEIEARMGAIVAGNHPFERKVVTREEAREALPGPALQARAHRRSSRGRGDLHVHAGRVHRPVPRAPRGEHRPSSSRRFQAALRRRRLLAGRREEHDAPAHLRDRLGDEGGSQRAPQAPRGDREARPPQAREGARPVLHSRGGRRGAGVLASQGGADPPRDRGLLARRASPERLRDPVHAAHRQVVAVGDVGASRLLQGEHVRAAVHRRGRLLPQADELPVPHHDLQEPGALLPGPAAALGRARARSTATSARACCTA